MRVGVDEFITTVDAIVSLPRDMLRADGLYTPKHLGSRAFSRLQERKDMFVSELGVHEMVLPLTGNLEITFCQTFSAEANLLSNADAGGVSGDDVCLCAMQSEAGRWRCEGKVEQSGDAFRAEPLTTNLSVHAPTGHGILGCATDDLEEIKKSGNAAIGKEADESVLGAITKAIEGLIELTGKEIVERLARRSCRKPGFKERTADFVDADELGTVVRTQWAEQYARGADESSHWCEFSIAYAGRLAMRMRRTGG